MEHGLYIHLPYCRSLCPYCAFAKAPLHHAEPARLLEALRREARMARAERAWDRPRTVFFGGGTPTALAPDDLRATLAWVREVNDRRFIDAVLAMDVEAVIERALGERSACSAGGALAAMGFARERGVSRGELLRYCTSRDVHPAESFVGYAGIVFSKGA